MANQGKTDIIRNHRLLSLVFLLILVAGLLSWLPVRYFESGVESRIAERAARTSGLLAQELNTPREALQSFSLDQGLLDRSAWYRSWEDNPIVTTLNDYVDTSDVYSLVMLVNNKGQLIAANNRDHNGEVFDNSKLYLKNFRDDAWFRDLERESFIRSLAGAPASPADVPVTLDDLHIDADARLCGLDYGRRSLSYSAPIYEDGKLVAFLSQRLRFAALEDYCAFLSQGGDDTLPGLSLLLIDGQGFLLSECGAEGPRRGDTDARDLGLLGPELNEAGRRALGGALEGASGFTWSFDGMGDTGARRVASYSSLGDAPNAPALDWTVMLCVERDELLQASGLQSTRRAMIAVFCLFFILILVGTVSIRRRLTPGRTVRRESDSSELREKSRELLKRTQLRSLPVSSHVSGRYAAGLVTTSSETSPEMETTIEMEAFAAEPGSQPVTTDDGFEWNPSTGAEDNADERSYSEHCTRLVKGQLEELSRELLRQEHINAGIREAKGRARSLKFEAEQAILDVETHEREADQAHLVCAAAEEKLAGARSEWEALSAELDRAARERLECSGDRDRALAEAEHARHDRDEAQCEVEQMRLELALLKKASEDARGECERVKQEEAELRARIEDIRLEIAALNGEMEEARAESELVARDLAETRERVEARRGELVETEDEDQMARLDVERALADVAEAQADMESARVDVLDARRREETMIAMADVSRAVAASAAAGASGARILTSPATASADRAARTPLLGSDKTLAPPATGFGAPSSGIPRMELRATGKRGVLNSDVEELALELSEATGEEVTVSEYDVEAMRLQVRETKLKAVARRPQTLGEGNRLHGGGQRSMKKNAAPGKNVSPVKNAAPGKNTAPVKNTSPVKDDSPVTIEPFTPIAVPGTEEFTRVNSTRNEAPAPRRRRSSMAAAAVDARAARELLRQEMELPEAAGGETRAAREPRPEQQGNRRKGMAVRDGRPRRRLPSAVG